MRKSIIKCCCVVSVVLGGICFEESSEAMLHDGSTLDAARRCQEMLSDPNETARSAFLSLANNVYIGNIKKGIQVAMVILREKARLDNIPANMEIFDIMYENPVLILDPPEGTTTEYENESGEFVIESTECREYSENTKFFTMMYLLKDSGISLSAAIDLANKAAQDPFVFRVWQANQKNPQFGLIRMMTLAKTMIATDCTNPNALAPVFESACGNLGMRFGTAVELWRDISDSKPVKDSLAILEAVNGLMEDGLVPKKIYEVATDLASGRKSFEVIRGELSWIFSQKTFDNLWEHLNQKGIVL
ncbi:MAG: hypothetical protein LBJ96_05075 [Holosporaceae bacterium]|jgi:hypothetical protein|nr:hypothetical protein [Holosporaceae bacterium]